MSSRIFGYLTLKHGDMFVDDVQIAKKINLVFDRGTIVLSGLAPEDAPPPADLRFVWDHRIDAYRAMASRYNKVVKSGFLQNTGISDLVKAQGNLKKEQTLEPALEISCHPELRPYQEAAIVAWISSGKRGTIVLPTGSGKTLLGIAVMAAIKVPTICLVPTRILLEQWHGVLKKYFKGEIGIVGDGTICPRNITVATYESAYRHMWWLGGRFDLIIADEVHHFGNGLKDEILEMSIAQYRLGLTATYPANVKQQLKLKELLGGKIFEKSISELTGSYLAEFEINQIKLSLNEKERASYDQNIAIFREFYQAWRERFPFGTWLEFLKTAYQSEVGRRSVSAHRRAKKISSFCQAKDEMLSSLLISHFKQKILIFTPETEIAYFLAKKYFLRPITSKTPRAERDEIIKGFIGGEFLGLVSCRVLNEGFDVPGAEVAIIIGGSQGTREFLQRLGRMLRKMPDKKAVIYELAADQTMETSQLKERRQQIAVSSPGIFSHMQPRHCPSLPSGK